jgi:hypothetical protein
VAIYSGFCSELVILFSRFLCPKFPRPVDAAEAVVIGEQFVLQSSPPPLGNLFDGGWVGIRTTSAPDLTVLLTA